MISTLEIKQRQFRDIFNIGREDATDTVLILGSCRSVAYLNYLQRYNESRDNHLRIYCLDPFNWHWNEREEVVDLESAINAMEKDERILSILRKTTIFIHEHYKYFGMFNTLAGAEKNIYQFGLNPRLNICIPNFHDHFILFREQMQFDQAIRDMYGVVPQETIGIMRERGLMALEKFYSVCRMSDFPEMEDEIRDNWRKRRFFWTGNHVSKNFTLFIMRQMNERFLKLDLDGYFWNGAGQEDQFSYPSTLVTQHDVDAYGLEWPDTPIHPLTND